MHINRGRADKRGRSALPRIWTKHPGGAIHGWMRHLAARLPRKRLFPATPRLLAALTTILAVILACALAPDAFAREQQDAACPADTAAWSDRPKQNKPHDAATVPDTPQSAMPAGPAKRILIVGDSFAVGLGLTMEQSFRPRGQVMLASRGKVSSGLNSPRFYDWEKSLAEFLDAEKPHALVVMLGGNDAKNGGGTPEWSQDFQTKASRFLTIAARHGVSVSWVGLPPMRERAFSQRAWVANEAMRSACGAAKSCRFIDSWDLFSDASGKFLAQKNIGGKVVSLRGKDGVHFSVAGCRLLTDRIATGMARTP